MRSCIVESKCPVETYRYMILGRMLGLLNAAIHSGFRRPHVGSSVGYWRPRYRILSLLQHPCIAASRCSVALCFAFFHFSDRSAEFFLLGVSCSLPLSVP